MEKMLHQTIDTAIKGVPDEVSLDLVQKQADIAASCLVKVSYKGTRGTCGDERKRIHLLNGKEITEVRPSVFGGPVIHATAIAELTGAFVEAESTADERATQVHDILETAGYPAGAHVACAAAKIGVWMKVLAANPDAVKAYGQMQLKHQYDESAMDEVINYAVRAADAGRYDDFDENNLQTILGEEESGEAFEVLAPVDHEGYLIERNTVSGSTIDQNKLYDESVIGKGSFDVDDGYATELEDAVVVALHPTEIARKTVLARHAREAIIAAVANVVPNSVLFQDTILNRR